MSTAPASAECPLAVDLDGTLCHSDTMVEALLVLLKRQPWWLLWLPFWWLRGRAALKREIAARAQLSLPTLPWNQPLVDWLQAEQRRGRVLLLCTGADAAIAESVAAHLGGFSAVFASDGRTNLTGARKQARLVAHYGERGFAYAGNARVDLAVWRSARTAVVVNGSAALTARAASLCPVERAFRPPAGSRLRRWARALRLHQWVKNLLVFLPLLLAHRFDGATLVAAIGAAASFCLCASSVYLLNDLLDLDADRQHPSKRFRPFAAATLPAAQGLLVAPLLLAAAVILAAGIAPAFAAVLLAYYLLTLAYSLTLKRRALVDVMVLAVLYTLRVIAGAAATEIPLSFWLLAFSMFLFLSLGIIKRVAEIQPLRGSPDTPSSGRGYRADDLPLLRTLGVTAGYSAVLVLALYINSPESQLQYRQPQWLWLLCPLLLYWISRAWLLTHRGQMHDDPVVFALRDGSSRRVAALAALVLLAAFLA